MKIFINGQVHDLTNLPNKTLTEVIALVLDDKQLHQPYAIALNGHFVGKDHYANTPLSPNDSLDILFPIQGG